MNKRRKNSDKWRIIWYQIVDGVRRLKWYTGSQYECEMLQRVCEATGEWYKVSEPGTFV